MRVCTIAISYLAILTKFELTYRLLIIQYCPATGTGRSYQEQALIILIQEWRLLEVHMKVKYFKLFFFPGTNVTHWAHWKEVGMLIMRRQCGGAGGTSPALGVPGASQTQLCLLTGSPICGSAAQARIALRLVLNLWKACCWQQEKADTEGREVFCVAGKPVVSQESFVQLEITLSNVK